MKYAQLALSLVSLILIAGCSQTYQRTPLTQLPQPTAPATIQSDITVQAEHMSRAQIHTTFGTRGRKLGYYGLCPIHLSIKNESADTLTFDPANTTIEYASHEQVAYCLQNHTIRNTTALVGLGLAATTIICLHTLPFALWFYLTGIGTTSLYLGVTTATGMLILTPTIAVYYAKNSCTQNERIAQDMKQIAISHTRAIEPGQELDVILFTQKCSCKKDFTVTLINEATQEPTVINVTH